MRGRRIGERINVKISKDLDEALESVSKEVDSWPAWKRSVDQRDLEKLTGNPERRPSSVGDSPAPARRPISARAAKAASAR